MNWTCPHCQKKVTFSTEQLNETHGVVVCPQCLSSDKVPGYDKPKLQQRKATSEQQSTPRMKTPPSHTSRPTPPPHRSKLASNERPNNTPTTPKPKKTSTQRKKKASRPLGRLTPHSALGCLWRSVVFTLILMLFYIVFGYILQGI